MGNYDAAKQVFFAFISKTVDNRCNNPYIAGKIFSSFTIWSKENGRILKFIADNSRLKKKNFKLELSAINFIFFPFSFDQIVELEKIFPAMYGLLHRLSTVFDINAKKHPS